MTRPSFYLNLALQLLDRLLVVVLVKLVLPTDGNEPNVFFVNDDTPAGQRLGRITHFDGQQNIPLDSGSLTSVIVRANRPPAIYFRLDEHKGDLYTRVVLDREVLCTTITGYQKGRSSQFSQYSLTHSQDYTWDETKKDITDECEFVFQVALHRKIKSSTLPEFIDIRVVIIDRNDHVPTFHPQQFVNLSVPESAPVGTRVRLPLAVDPDSFDFAIRRYQLFPDDVTEWSLHQQTADRVFRGNLHHEITDLFLELRCTLDRERRGNFILEVKAYDTLNEPTTANYDERNVLKVYLTIEDINDNGPTFRPQSHKNFSSSIGYLADSLHSAELITYKAEITETVWPKSSIIKLEAFDPDLPPYAAIRYEFPIYVDSTIRSFFKLNEHSGELFLRQPLDYEKKSSYSFDVLAIDSEHHRRMKLEGTGAVSTSDVPQSDPYTATARVVVQVVDINDEIPVIELDYLRLDSSTGRPATFATVEENSDPPQFLADIFVTDKDVNPLNNHVTCSLEPLQASYSQLWQAKFKNETTATQENIYFQLSEVRRRAGQVQYNLLTLKPLDRETVSPSSSVQRIHVNCFDSGVPTKANQAVVLINLLDVNDNEPVIQLLQPVSKNNISKQSSNGNASVYLYENSPLGTLVARLNVTDMDIGQNGRVTCSLITQVDSVDKTYLGHFHIDPTNCDIVIRKIIDREATDIPLQKIRLTIKAEDHGNPPKTTLMNLNVIILDENDNAPLLQHTYYRFTVKENMPAGTSIGRLVIMDMDEMYDKLTVRFYKHDNLPFQLWLENPNVTSTNNVEKKSAKQPVTYHINTTTPLDRETRENYEFKILVLDTSENHNIYRSKPPVVHTTTATVSVLVEDVNDNDPVIIFPQQANKTFYLSNAESKNHQLMTVNANDKDTSNIHFLFTLVSETSAPMALINQVSTNSNEGFTHTAEILNPSFLEIDRNQGTIYLSRDMSENDTGLHAFYVTVQDTDTPVRTASLRFLVQVDATPPRSHRLQGSYPHLLSSETQLDMLEARSSNSIGTAQDNQLAEMHSRLESMVSVGKMSEKKRPLKKPLIPSFTGDAVLILSLGLILLLLLATLCLVVYARRWNSAVVRRPTASLALRPCVPWACARFCDKRSINSSTEKAKELPTEASDVERIPRLWSPCAVGFNSSVQSFYTADKLTTSMPHDNFLNTLDDSTLNTLHNSERTYHNHVCRPLTVVAANSTLRSEVAGKTADDYTSLQSISQCHTCTLPNKHSCSHNLCRLEPLRSEQSALLGPIPKDSSQYTPLMNRTVGSVTCTVVPIRPIAKQKVSVQLMDSLVKGMSNEQSKSSHNISASCTSDDPLDSYGTLLKVSDFRLFTTNYLAI
ncbi:protocadherin delta 1 [Paragonimus westermani]|uniref:Protocadherin delta 1 n=1 Tax=Paragonimus westermani TaxID=34504 RepID=A0A5J4NN45_9TREM|nr:protocadherin delta 1 [Paragonimus westermani]